MKRHQKPCENQGNIAGFALDIPTALYYRVDKKGYPYPYPLFRRIGSTIFKMLIKNICNTKITDPTSGFQMLKRNVFGRYARMYNYPQYPDANLIIEMLLNKYKKSSFLIIFKRFIFLFLIGLALLIFLMQTFSILLVFLFY